jgi:hypothetical protein
MKRFFDCGGHPRGNGMFESDMKILIYEILQKKDPVDGPAVD